MAISTARDERAMRPVFGAAPARRSELARAWRRFRRYKPGLAGGTIVLLLIFMAIFAPVVAPYSPTEKVGRRATPPSTEFWLGLDEIGRDVLSRLIYGSRVALIVGIGAMAIHGHKSQSAGTKALAEFKDGSLQVLVAARSLGILAGRLIKRSRASLML